MTTKMKLTEEIFITLYKDICEFRRLFGLPVQTGTHWDTKGLHLELYCEEFIELALAESRVLKIDGIVDTVYVLMGHIVEMVPSQAKSAQNNAFFDQILESNLRAADALGFDFLQAWDIVHASNLSKICTAENINASLKFYQDLGVNVGSEAVDFGAQKQFRVKVKEASTDINGKSHPVGKVLKSIDYTEADLTGL